MIEVAQASNSAEALTLEGQQAHIQPPNSLQTQDLAAISLCIGSSK